MADVRPFRAIRYRTDAFNAPLEAVVAPPYDVIDDVEQSALYARHPKNVVRLDLNEIKPTDDAENNRYTRARRHLMDWLAEGVLGIDENPAIYAHTQTFVDESGKEITRRGFLARIRLAEYSEGIVLPHERTLRGPKEDRLALMKAAECNLSPVFLLYEDAESKIDAALEAKQNASETVTANTADGIQHTLWPVFDADVQRVLADHLSKQSVLIADGHHRYETALAYRDWRRSVAEEPHPDAPYDFVLAFFVNAKDPDLAVYPTHRVVHDVADFDPSTLFSKLDADARFSIERLDDKVVADAAALRGRLETAGKSAPSFVLLARGDARLVSYVGDFENELFDSETPVEVRELDVAVLHEAIFDRMLGISKAAQEAKTNLGYIKGFDLALKGLDDPANQLLVMMNATPVAQVDRVCRSGGKMPQKSTFFYPKVLTGLVINPL